MQPHMRIARLSSLAVFGLLIGNSLAQLPRIPIRIPTPDRIPLGPVINLQGEEPVSTTFRDAKLEAAMPDSFSPAAFRSLFDLPTGPGGGFLLQPGAYEAVIQSFCLHAGAHGPSTGDGYLYAPLKGAKAPVIRSLLRGIASHPEIPQQDVQSLIWAIEARAKLSELSPKLQQTAFSLLTRKEIADLNGGALGMIPDPLLKRALASLPPEIRSICELQARLRSGLSDPTVSFPEIERIAMAAGPAPPSGPVIPRGRWSAHPGGFFVRYLPSGYSQTRLEVYVPRKQLCGPASAAQLAIEFDPTMDVAVPANTNAQRLGLSGASFDKRKPKAEQCLRVGHNPCPPGDTTCTCPQGASCKMDVSATFSYSYCCPDGQVPCKGVCVPDTPEERRKCRECEDCGAGTTCCSDKCVDLSSDNNNCGACGNVCYKWGAVTYIPESTGVATGGEVYRSTCVAATCQDKVVQKCSGGLPYACATSCKSGGPCCVGTSDACPE